ncbi:M4 family metallopeptidase [Sorangium sp. So ce1128]
MLSNGLYSQSFHSDESTDLMSYLQAEEQKWPDVAAASAEEAARRYLWAVLSPASPEATMTPEPETAAKPDFKAVGVEKSPLTDTQFVKFRQYHQNIPVYGSLVTVELGSQNRLMAMNSALGSPLNVDPIARISPAQAVEAVEQDAGSGACRTSAAPSIQYFYDNGVDRWRLAYIFEDVPSRREAPETELRGVPEIFDYVVDAHDGKIIAKMPRVQNAAATVTNIDERRAQAEGPVLETAPDDLDQEREFVCFQQDGRRILIDPELNVHTYDFSFHDAYIESGRLPGAYVTTPPTPWLKSAISAHANARIVAAFYRDVLRRSGVDNRGHKFISTVQCLYGSGGRQTREWRNAVWNGEQMIYGQRLVAGALRGYAASLDVVAHEITHGVTQYTSRLEYRFESGAMNESYSDIFGIIISNYNEPDIGRWNWQLGEELDPSGMPIRDVSEPTRYRQPDHMNAYQRLPMDIDEGGVHINSGIHNKAFYNLITSRDVQGRYLFSAEAVAVLFYLTMTQRLASTSRFSDSYRGVLLSAQTYFRNDPARDVKIAAVRRAFEAVGIRLTSAAPAALAMLRLAA